jgi:hypothetical protein
MSISMPDTFANARHHPDNAHLPLTNRPETILGTTITFLSIAVIAVALRLWGRLRDRLWGWDDFFVLLAAIASCMGDVVVCLSRSISDIAAASTNTSSAKGRAGLALLDAVTRRPDRLLQGIHRDMSNAAIRN